jgi:Putative Actinobacterial Holin-X, holin superfamily III
MAQDRAPSAPDGPPIPELLGALAEQTTRLVQGEIELAKAEMATKGKRAGVGAGAFSAAGVVALLALGAATAAAILGLAAAVAAWLAALIVAAVYLLLAGVLALVGRSKVRQATPPVPEQALQSAKADAQEIKEKAKEGRHEHQAQTATRTS